MTETTPTNSGLEDFSVEPVSDQSRADAGPLRPTPSGWQLAPVEPTHEMRVLGSDCFDQRPSEAAHIYRTMLAAAPPAVASQQPATPGSDQKTLLHTARERVRELEGVLRRALPYIVSQSSWSDAALAHASLLNIDISKALSDPKPSFDTTPGGEETHGE